MPSDVKKRRRMIIMYACFAAVLAALVLSIVFRSKDRIQYGLPAVPKVSAEEIDAITVKGGESGEIKLQRKDASWVIEPEGYRADADAVDDMLDSFADFTVTDLVSTSGHFETYDLDDRNKLTVTASGGGKELFSFDLGKRAPSYNHTYVSLGDGQVYNAASDLRRIFEKDAETLRSRRVLSFAGKEIVRIHAVLPGGELILAKANPAVGDTAGSAAQAGTWQTPDGAIWDTEIVDELLDRLDDLECSSFADRDSAKAGEPLLSLKLQGLTGYELDLLEREDAGYRARSSQADSEFYISSWQGDNILETFAGVVPAVR